VFQNRCVDLRVLLQPGMTGELIKGKESQDHDGGADRPVLHAAGVLSNCSFAHTRRGFNSSDF
jgi:hypothetical protein